MAGKASLSWRSSVYTSGTLGGQGNLAGHVSSINPSWLFAHQETVLPDKPSLWTHATSFLSRLSLFHSVVQHFCQKSQNCVLLREKKKFYFVLCIILTCCQQETIHPQPTAKKTPQDLLKALLLRITDNIQERLKQFSKDGIKGLRELLKTLGEHLSRLKLDPHLQLPALLPSSAGEHRQARWGLLGYHLALRPITSMGDLGWVAASNFSYAPMPEWHLHLK